MRLVQINHKLTSGNERGRVPVPVSRHDFLSISAATAAAFLLAACTSRSKSSSPQVIDVDPTLVATNEQVLNYIVQLMGISPTTSQSEYHQLAYDKSYSDPQWGKNLSLGKVTLPNNEVSDLLLTNTGEPYFNDIAGTDEPIFNPQPVDTLILTPDHPNNPTVVIYGSINTTGIFSQRNRSTPEGKALLDYFATVFKQAGMTADVVKVVHLVFAPYSSDFSPIVVSPGVDERGNPIQPISKDLIFNSEAYTARLRDMSDANYQLLKRIELAFNLGAIYNDSNFLGIPPTKGLMAAIVNERVSLLAESKNTKATDHTEAFSSLASSLMQLGSTSVWNPVLLDGTDPQALIPVMEEVQRLVDLAK